MPTSLIENLKNVKILVIGDLMLDHYLWGDVHPISPEAPVPVVHVTGDTYNAGGATNVALNLANLGVQTVVLGYYANDEAGLKLVKKNLSENGVEIIQNEQLPDVPTIIKTRVIVRNQQLCRLDREAERNLYKIDTSANFENELDVILSKVDAVIVSDYEGVITQSLIDTILKKSKSVSNLLVAVDPKPSRQLSFSGVGLLTPNRNEALELAGIAQLHPQEKYPLEEVCRRIHEIYNPKLLVITLGAEGLVICEQGKIMKHLSTEAREVFDVSGAGDPVIATLTAALVSGASPVQATRLANGAAGCVVAHLGTVPVKFEEVETWLIKQSDL